MSGTGTPTTIFGDGWYALGIDPTGNPVALDDQEGGDPQLTFQAASTGAYEIGVSSAGDDAYIYSPMAMLDGTMKIKTVTWTQDNNQGTQTTLELVAPWGLNDTIGANVGNPGMPQLSK